MALLLEEMARLTFRLRHAIQAVLTQRLLIVVVLSLSVFLFLFLPFALGVELFVVFGTLFVGVWVCFSALMCMPMLRLSISCVARRRARSYCQKSATADPDISTCVPVFVWFARKVLRARLLLCHQ
jgi:hypothetical protein